MTISQQEPEIFRGQPASFSAVASDPDTDPLTVGWAVVISAACADSRDPSKWPKVEMEGPLELQRTFKIEAAPSAPFCVWAFVKDSHGAVGVSTDPVTPRIRPPIPVITQGRPDVAASYPLYSDFVFNAGVRFEPANPIDFSWTLTAPAGFVGGLENCDPSLFVPEQVCLHADVPGRYVVELKATDGQEISLSPDAITVDVMPDRPPCIATTEPPFASFWDGDPTQDAAFKVTRIDDDGDPQDLHYAWFYARPDQPWTFADIDFPQFDVKANTFQLGDEVDVRVEIRDRPNQTAIENALLGCGDDRVCSARAIPGCFQRVTWAVKWTL